MTEKKPGGCAQDPAPGTADPPQRISSSSLLGKRREIVIEHDGREYRLRVTQQGKLILTA